jgi:transposase
MMTNTIEVPFDIEDVEVLNIESMTDGQLIITVKSTIEGTCCHKCGNHIKTLYDHGDARTVRHTSVFGSETYIRFFPKRYECPYCSKTTTQSVPWCEPRCHHTIAYENHVLLQLVNSTVSDVSIKENLSFDSIEGIIKRRISTSVNWDLVKKIELLGIDEISIKKGHKDFVTIVTARVDGKTIILAVLKDRTKKTVKKFLKTIPRRLRKTIVAVCSDMYDGFINAAKEVLRGVRIVVDRFHVSKLYRKGLDDLRKSEMRRLKKELSSVEYKELKNVMWILRKRPFALDCEEKMVLKLLFKYSPVLELAYFLCNDLTCIFDQHISRFDANIQIKAWKRRVKKSKFSRLKFLRAKTLNLETCFDSFLSTLTSREKEILNYFDERLTSGFVEGLNNKLKVIKRRCYGILNIGHWFQRIYLDLEGYSLFA